MYKIKAVEMVKGAKMKIADRWRQIKKLPFYIVFARYMKAVINILLNKLLQPATYISLDFDGGGFNPSFYITNIRR